MIHPKHLESILRDAVVESGYQNPKFHIVPSRITEGHIIELPMFPGRDVWAVLACQPDETQELLGRLRTSKRPFYEASDVGKGVHDTAFWLLSCYGDLTLSVLVWMQAGMASLISSLPVFSVREENLLHELSDFSQKLKEAGLSAPRCEWHNLMNPLPGSYKWLAIPKNVPDVAGWLCAVAASMSRRMEIVVVLSAKDREVPELSQAIRTWMPEGRNDEES